MPDDPMLVSVADLRRSVDVLLRHVEATAGDAVALSGDYFWSVPPDALYNVTEQPQELTIGQLSESWQHVRDLLADEDRALFYHLEDYSECLAQAGI